MSGRASVRAIAVVTALAALAALPGTATAARAVRYHWSFQGSMTHDWTVAGTEPCDPVGTGRVSTTFTAQGGTFTATSNRFGPLYLFHPTSRAHGTITLSDDTTLVPAPPDAAPCDPTDKSGCRTYTLTSDALVNVELPALRGRPWTLNPTGFRNAIPDSACNKGLFDDYDDINARPLTFDAHFPSWATFMAGRARTVVVAETRHDHDGPISSTTHWRIEIRFTR